MTPLKTPPMVRSIQELQASVLQKYRKSGDIPTLSEITIAVAVSFTTVAKFMAGKPHPELQKYVTDRLQVHAQDPDVAALLAAWDKESAS